jgi:hypothetical protein
MEGVHREPLQTGDLNGLPVVAVHHAGPFAKYLYGAGSGTACAEDVGVEDRAGGTGEIAGGDLFDEFWYVDMSWAGSRAGRIEAEETAVRFGNRGLHVEGRMNVSEARSDLWAVVDLRQGLTIAHWTISSHSDEFSETSRRFEMEDSMIPLAMVHCFQDSGVIIMHYRGAKIAGERKPDGLQSRHLLD